MDFVESLRAAYPNEEVDHLLDALSKPSTHAFYLNTRKLSDEALLSLYPSLVPHPFIPHAYSFDESLLLGKSLAFNLGAFYIMDAGSMLPPFLLAPKPGERILDLCAAPGGKTAMMSLMMGDEGVILSNDLSYPRSLENSGNVERLGLANVAVTSGDFASCWNKYEAYFDAILLDAPCSGSAMFRKDARLKDDWSYAKVQKNQKTQIELLDLAGKMVRPGGRIVYSTCSFSYEEDEGSALAFLESHPEFHPSLPFDDPSFYHHPDLKEGIHLFPHRYPGEGQFALLLFKEGEPTLHVKEKLHPIDKKYLSFTEEFGLKAWDYLHHNDAIYALPEPLRIQGLSLLRYGVKLGKDAIPFQPDHALASALGKARANEIDENDAMAYLRGETFPTALPDGYHVVSYLGMPLGYIKAVHGTAKNHYPRGLRRRY